MLISNPTIIALKSTGAKIDSIGILNTVIWRKARVVMAASKVASVPNIRSIGLKDARFESKHPMASAGIAAGVKMGSIVNASDMRNCIGP